MINICYLLSKVMCAKCNFVVRHQHIPLFSRTPISISTLYSYTVKLHNSPKNNLSFPQAARVLPGSGGLSLQLQRVLLGRPEAALLRDLAPPALLPGGVRRLHGHGAAAAGPGHPGAAHDRPAAGGQQGHGGHRPEAGEDPGERPKASNPLQTFFPKLFLNDNN